MFNIDFEDENNCEVFYFDYEITNEDINKYLTQKGFNNYKDYWQKISKGNQYLTVYPRIQKPTNKILVYSYLHEYDKLQNGEPIKISEVRTVIKDVK